MAAAWREEFLTDLVERAGEAGIEVFNEEHEERLWAFIEEQADSKLKAGIRKNYRRAKKMTALGRKKLMTSFKEIWSPNASKARKNAAPKVTQKAHSGAKAPTVEPKEQTYCNPLEDGCGKPIDDCRCEVRSPIDRTPACMACGDSRRNSKGGLCVCISGKKRSYFGKKEAMIWELRCAGVFRVGKGPIDKLSKSDLKELAEKHRKIAEGTAPAAPQPPAPPPATKPKKKAATPPAPPKPMTPPPPPPNAKLVPPPPPPNAALVAQGRNAQILPPPPPPKQTMGEAMEQTWNETFPEDGGCSHDRLDLQLGACKICGEIVQEPCKHTGRQMGKKIDDQNDEVTCMKCGFKRIEKNPVAPPTPPAPPKMATPAPPAPPAKTYGPKPVNGNGYDPHVNKPTMRVCFSARLDDQLDDSVVVTVLNSYLVEQTGFGATITGGEKLGRKDGRWFDLLVDYSINITDAYGHLLTHPNVLDAEAKPAADVGVVNEL